jgi:hypothetical protein
MFWLYQYVHLFQEYLTFFILSYVTKYLFSNYVINNKTKDFYVVLNILGQITFDTVNSSLQEVCMQYYFFPFLCLALHASYMSAVYQQ